MPTYDYQCAKGHVTERIYRMNDERPSSVKCRVCKGRAKRIYTSAPAVQDDFPVHFNISMGRVVKSRAHHRQLQRELGCEDVDPKRGTPMWEKLHREGKVE